MATWKMRNVASNWLEADHRGEGTASGGWEISHYVWDPFPLITLLCHTHQHAGLARWLTLMRQPNRGSA